MVTPTSYKELVESIIVIIQLAIPTLFGVLFVYMMWKMIDSWVLHAGDQMKREEGRKYAVAGVLVFVLMISAWGIVTMIKSSLFS